MLCSGFHLPTSQPVCVRNMKPNCQNWNKVTKSWLNNVGVYVNKDAEIKVGNFVQTGILHYTDNKFIETTSVYNKFKVKAYV